jgi:hypothetical protein
MWDATKPLCAFASSGFSFIFFGQVKGVGSVFGRFQRTDTSFAGIALNNCNV